MRLDLSKLPSVVPIQLGSTLADVALTLKDFEVVPTEKGRYTFEAAYNKKKRTFQIFVPELREDGTYLFGNHSYVGVPLLSHPPVVFSNRPRSRVCTVADPGGADLIFTLFKGRTTAKRGATSFGQRTLAPFLRTVFLTKADRGTFNFITGSEEVGSYLTEEDIKTLLFILKNCTDMENDPKLLSEMRAISMEDMILRTMLFSMQFAFKPFCRGGDISGSTVNLAVSRFLATSPQCQLYRGDNPMALLGLKEKIKAPMRAWAPPDEAEPSPSWERAICVVDTPQSARAGEILALAHGAKIIDGKVIPGKELLSGLLKKVTLFPHLLDPHRTVMVSSIAEQSCKLPANDEILIIPEGAEGLPSPFGCYGTMALMDYGYTHEDGCVVSESFAEKLSTAETHIDSIVVPVSRKGEEPTILIEPGATILPFQKIMMDLDGEPVRSKVKASGIVKEVATTMDVIGGAECAVFKVISEITFNCEIGTKLSGLHGNKATISRILPDWLMPKGLSGAVDIIYSPASVAKRKMPALVMEMMVTKWIAKRRIADPSFVYHSTGKETFEEVSGWLVEEGIDPTAMEQLHISEDFPNKTLVGPVFLMMLHHHPRAKLRIGGQVTHDFRGMQQRGVGQGRYNREELEVLFQWQANGLIAEIYDTVGSSSLFEIVKEYLKVLGVWEAPKAASSNITVSEKAEVSS